MSHPCPLVQWVVLVVGDGDRVDSQYLGERLGAESSDIFDGSANLPGGRHDQSA